MRSYALNTSEIVTDLAKPLCDVVWFSVYMRSIVGGGS